MWSFVRSEHIARTSAYLLFVLTPFFILPLAWVSVAQSKLLLAVILSITGFLAWVGMSLGASKLRIPKSPLLIAASIIPLAYVLSSLGTGPTWVSFFGDGRGYDTVVGFIVWYIALFLVAQMLSETRERVKQTFRLLVIAGAVVVFAQLIHLVWPTFTLGDVLSNTTSSVVGSWHDLGIFLGLTTFVSLALLRTRAAEGYWYLGLIALAITSFLILIIIGYADIWIGLSGASLFYAFLFYRASAADSSTSHRGSIMGWILLAGIAIGMYFGGVTIRTYLPTSFQITQFEVRPSWSGTLSIGREVFAEPAHVFLGSGPSTFSREWEHYKPLSVNTTEFWNTDFYYGVGFIPTSLITTGVLGLLAWGAVGGALLWGLWRFVRRFSTSDMLRAALFGSALYLTLFHLLYVPGPGLSLLTFLLFGALVAEELSRGDVSEFVVSLSRDSWGGKIAIFVLTLFSIVLFFVTVQFARAIISDTLLNRAVFLYGASGDVSAALRSVSRAIAVLPRNDRAHRGGVELGILELARMAASGDSSEKARVQLQATLNATITHGLAAVSIESGDYQNWLTLARLYGELSGVGVEGAEKNARDAYAAARKSNPVSPLPDLGEAQLDLAKGGDAAARKNLEAALLLKPNLASTLYLLSQVEARSGNLDKALEYAVRVTQVAAADSLGWYNLGTILYVQGRFDLAAQAFGNAVGIQNNYANALFLLGLSYDKLGRTDEALRALKAVSQLNPDHAGLKETIKEIERKSRTSEGFGE